MKKLLLPLICFVLIIGCTKDDMKNYSIETIDGVTVYKNSNKPSVDNLVISPKEVLRIGGIEDKEFIWPRFLDADDRGNIYIVDAGSASVLKFDAGGTFIKRFGKEGDGPGEMKLPFMINLLNGVLYVASNSARRLVKFDTDGNFIDNLVIKGALPRVMQTVGKDKFICFQLHHKETDKGVFYTHNLVLTDSQAVKTVTLNEYKAKFDPTNNDYLDRFVPYAVGKDKLFVAHNSEDRYRIDVFDFSGQLLHSIEKDYDKVPFNQDETDELNKGLEATFKKFGVRNYFPVKAKYKKAITGLFYDKEGRLLVVSSIPRNENNRYDLFVDVFKDGVFLAKVKMDLGKKAYDFVKLHDEKTFFKGNRIYYLDETRALIKVFEY